MKIIAFHDNNLCLRGTTNAMFDYADYNEKILGNKSIIVAPPGGNLDALDKFKTRFGESNIHLMNFHSYHDELPKMNVDYLYIIKTFFKYNSRRTSTFYIYCSCSSCKLSK